MEEDINTGDTCQGDPQAQSIAIPPGDSGIPPTRANGEGTSATSTSTHGGIIPTGVNRLRFGTPEPPTIPKHRQHLRRTSKQVYTPLSTGSKLRGPRQPESQLRNSQRRVHVGLKLKRKQRKGANSPHAGDTAAPGPPRIR